MHPRAFLGLPRMLLHSLLLDMKSPLRLLALILFVTLLPTAAAQQPALQADWVQSPINGHWYGVDYTPRTWTDSEALAVSLGGHLATVRSQAEQDWIAAQFVDYLLDHGIWIGLEYTDPDWEWSSGEPWNYGTSLGSSPWGPTQPNNPDGEPYVILAGPLVTPGTDDDFAWHDAPAFYGPVDLVRGLIELPTKPQVGWSWPHAAQVQSFPHVGSTTGDIDGDGLKEVVLGYGTPGPNHLITVLTVSQNGVATVAETIDLSPAGNLPSGGQYVLVLDFDGDGDRDIVVGKWSFGTILVENLGGLSFAAPVQVLPGHVASGVGDLDGDGDIDLITDELGVGTLHAWIAAPGIDPLQVPVQISDLGGSYPQVADFNSDGIPDVACTNEYPHQLKVVFSTGPLSWSPAVVYPTSSRPYPSSVGDLDGDGDVDIVVPRVDSGDIYVYMNDGAGAFAPPVAQGTQSGPHGSSLGDVDGDGDLDLVLPCYLSDTVQIMLNDGTGAFTSSEYLGGLDYAIWVDLVDFDGNGRLDIVVNAHLAGTTTVYLNQRQGDCNQNGTPDSDDIANGTSLDCNLNNIPDECEEDCNQNGIPDSCDIASGFALDCNQNGIPDWCDINNDPSLDVNLNSIPDSCEGPGRTWILSPVTGNWYAVTDPLSADQAELQASNWGGHLVTVNDQAENDWLASQFGDATHPFWIGLTDVVQEGVYQWINGEPVGYLNWRAGEPDDAPGVFGADFTILYPPTANWLDEPSVPPTWPLPRGVVELVSSDCDGNGLPDVWELIADPSLDCDDNDVHDLCDLQDPSLDCDGDDVLDSCQIESDPSLDCDGNGSIDSCEILADGSLDCDGVQGLDSCQIELDPSLDWDGNDVLDSCAGGGPSYCFGNINAAGNVGSIEASGSPLIADNNLTISSHGLPIGQPGYYLFSANSAYVNPFGGGAGVLCLGAPIRRLNHLAGYPVLFVNAAGDVSLTLDLGNLPATILVPGDVYIFQLWHREFDQTTGNPTSNTTDSMRLMFR